MADAVRAHLPWLRSMAAQQIALSDGLHRRRRCEPSRRPSGTFRSRWLPFSLLFLLSVEVPHLLIQFFSICVRGQRACERCSRCDDEKKEGPALSPIPCQNMYKTGGNSCEIFNSRLRKRVWSVPLLFLVLGSALRWSRTRRATLSPREPAR